MNHEQIIILNLSSNTLLNIKLLAFQTTLNSLQSGGVQQLCTELNKFSHSSVNKTHSIFKHVAEFLQTSGQAQLLNQVF